MLAIRLARYGSTHRPCYRVVVNDSRKTPRGRQRDVIGHYDPRKEPQILEIDLAKADYWIQHGAQPSDTVKSLIKKLQEKAKAVPAGTEE